MHLQNKTSTITVAVVAALVALAIVAHVSGALTLSPSHPAGHGTVQGPAGHGTVPGPAGAGPGGAATSGSTATTSTSGRCCGRSAAATASCGGRRP